MSNPRPDRELREILTSTANQFFRNDLRICEDIVDEEVTVAVRGVLTSEAHRNRSTPCFPRPDRRVWSVSGTCSTAAQSCLDHFEPKPKCEEPDAAFILKASLARRLSTFSRLKSANLIIDRNQNYSC